MKRAFTRWKKDEAMRAMRNSLLIFKSSALDIRILPKTATPARVLIVTPRKSGNAVERNLFRRRARALFYDLSLHEGTHDWLIFAKNISDLSFTELRSILVKAASDYLAPSSGT